MSSLFYPWYILPPPYLPQSAVLWSQAIWSGQNTDQKHIKKQIPLVHNLTFIFLKFSSFIQKHFNLSDVPFCFCGRDDYHHPIPRIALSIHPSHFWHHLTRMISGQRKQLPNIYWCQKDGIFKGFLDFWTKMTKIA